MPLFDDDVDTMPGSPPAVEAGTSVLTITELTKCIRAVIEAEDLFRDVWVRGEISNLTRHSSGHTYFSLKDQSALIRCVMWNSASRVSKLALAEGMGVLARGRVTLYEKQGQYQLTVSEVTPDGVGALYTALEKLKVSLGAEGLFDKERKKPVPLFPRKVAIITSPTAAALRDMVTIARRRMPSVDLLLVPALMQGADSERSVVESLALADTLSGADVIVLGRGGGSLEDLWSFNSEAIVRAICACRTPVVSAIGHETDFTLSDFAADLRAPTPSAAMELIVPDRTEVLARVDTLAGEIGVRIGNLVASKRSRLELLARSGCLTNPERMLHSRWQTLDSLEEQLGGAFRLRVSRCEAQLAEASGRLDSLSPLAVLSRGYGIARRVADGSVVKRIADTSVGESIEVVLSDGAVVSEVKEIREGWH